MSFGKPNNMNFKLSSRWKAGSQATIPLLPGRFPHWLVRLGLLGCVLSNTSSAAAQDETVYWSRPEFIIPFQVDPNGVPPREVILEASEDDGATWYVVSRGDIRTKQFRFQAPQNGNYQFRLKMVDDAGRKFNNPGKPLRIHVDTDKPKAKLIVDMDQRGTLLAEFQVLDPNLDVNTLKLEYQTEESQEWQTIPFEVNEGGSLQEWLGSGTWNVPSRVRQLVVRLTAKDKAGNTVEVTRVPNLPKTAMGNSGLQFASQPRFNGTKGNQEPPPSGMEIGSGLSNPTVDLPRVQILGQNAGASLMSPALVNQPNGPASQPKLDTTGVQQELIDRQQKLIEQLLQQQKQSEQAKVLDKSFDPKATDTRGIPLGGNPLDLQDSKLLIAPPSEIVSTSPTTPTPRGKNSLLKSSPSATGPVRELTDEEIQAITSQGADLQLAEATGNRSILTSVRNGSPSSPSSGFPTAPNPELGTAKLGEPLSKDRVPLYSGSRSFSLEYGIDNDIGAPVRGVELWGTTDGGSTWMRWGEDPDRASPFDIEVESDGLFGFRMVIVGTNGLASNRPHNGDEADAWVQVDTMKPKARIQSALYGKGPEAGSLVIEYALDDSNLGERPVSLFYSSRPDGPWQEIATSLRNNGRYLWAADPNLPPAVYLRLKAVDAAGNSVEHILDVPVKVQGIAPRGRIHGIGSGPRGE